MAEPDQLALHAPVPPQRVLCREADHELADRRRRGRPPRTPAARVVPLARDQPTVPGEQRHRRHLTPLAARDQSRQRRQPQPVGWLVANPADLAAQDRVLVPEHQDFGVLAHPVPRQHRQAAEQAAYEQVEDGNDHSAMIPAGKPDQARSNNRAPHGECAHRGNGRGIRRRGRANGDRDRAGADLRTRSRPHRGAGRRRAHRADHLPDPECGPSDPTARRRAGQAGGPADSAGRSRLDPVGHRAARYQRPGRRCGRRRRHPRLDGPDVARVPLGVAVHARRNGGGRSRQRSHERGIRGRRPVRRPLRRQCRMASQCTDGNPASLLRGPEHHHAAQPGPSPAHERARRCRRRPGDGPGDRRTLTRRLSQPFVRRLVLFLSAAGGTAVLVQALA